MGVAFGGLYVATLSPLDDAGRLNLEMIRKHVGFLVDSGVNGLSPCGTTGEFLYLSTGEKVRGVEEVCAAVNGRVPVMAGVWALTAKETTLLTKAAQAAGASAVFLPPPIYYPASDEVVFRHYASVREASSLPVFAYNIPGYAANTVTYDCIERMVGEGVLAGVKDSTGKADQVRELVARFGSRITVMAASDSFATEGRKIGAAGFISALANVWPKAFARLWAGDELLQPAVDAARTALKKAGGIPATKYLTTLRGFPMGSSRLPFSELTADQLSALESAFQAATEQGLA